MIISENGTIIKVASGDISKIGRATQGVKVMRIDDSRVSRLAITPKSEEDDDESEQVDGNTEPAIDTATETPEEQ